MKNAIIDMNSTDGLNSRMEGTEERHTFPSANLKTEQQIVPNPNDGNQTEKKNQHKFRALWDINKRSSIHIIRLPEKEEKQYLIGKVLEETMAENPPNLAEAINVIIKKLRISRTG